MLRTTKKDAEFYTAFANVIAVTQKAADALNSLMNDYADIGPKIRQMTEYEHECDALIHKLFEKVHASFITPIDREDILLLAKSLDDIMDEIDETAHLFHVYNTPAIKPEAAAMAKLTAEAVTHLAELIRLLPNMKASDEMMAHIIEVNRLENQGDTLYREELTKLFRNETDAIAVIRWNGIYSQLENALDACEHVANVIEGVVLKHA